MNRAGQNYSREGRLDVTSGAVVRLSADTPALSRVLVADPDESLLAGYRECFWEDFDLVTATNGVECLARLRERTPDVLVLEPDLPWGGGDGVLAVMRQVFQLAHVPVMIVTASRDVSVLKGVAPFRISDYCVKPLAAGELATRIRTLLRLRPARREFEETIRTRNTR